MDKFKEELYLLEINKRVEDGDTPLCGGELPNCDILSAMSNYNIPQLSLEIAENHWKICVNDKDLEFHRKTILLLEEVNINLKLKLESLMQQYTEAKEESNGKESK